MLKYFCFLLTRKWVFLWDPRICSLLVVRSLITLEVIVESLLSNYLNIGLEKVVIHEGSEVIVYKRFYIQCLTEKWFSICDQEWDFIRVVSMANLVTFSEMKVYWWQRHYLSGLLFSLVCKQPLHCQETFNFQEDQTKWSLDCNRKDRHSLTSCGRS